MCVRGVRAGCVSVCEEMNRFCIRAHVRAVEAGARHVAAHLQGPSARACMLAAVSGPPLLGAWCAVPRRAASECVRKRARACMRACPPAHLQSSRRARSAESTTQMRPSVFS